MTNQDPDFPRTPDAEPDLRDTEAVPSVPPADEASADPEAWPTEEEVPTPSDHGEEAAGQDASAAPADEEDDEAEVEEDPLTATQRERDEYLDALRRKQAEFENFRKRMMRDGAAQRILGHAEVAERMLDVLDDFDRTIAAAGDEVDPSFLKGVQLVHDKLTGVLDDFGLTRIEDGGEPFDPNRHEAVQQAPDDQDLDEPLVHQVLRPGYELGGRVLRPAMVVVQQ